jgi:hypothetical protein
MPGWMAASIVVGFLVLVGVPILWLIFRSGYAPDPDAAERFRQRQRTPDFDLFRRRFEPVDAEHLNGVVWPGTEGYYAFANNGAGDKYLIDPRQSDPDVIYYEHETGKTRPVGATLSRFITVPPRR